MAKKRKDGRYENKFTVEGKRYTVYGNTAAECREKEARKRQEIAAGLKTKGKNQTVEKYFELWMEAREGSVKPATLRINRTLFNTIKKAKIDNSGTRFGTMVITKVETDHIRAVQNYLKQKDSTRTVNDKINLLKSIFKSAVDERILTWNPAASVKMLKRTEEAARDTIHRALTREETAAFLEAAEESWYYPLYVFLLNTGLRLGEAGALTVWDVTAKGINVERTITRTESGGYEVGQDTKTMAGRRYIPLSDDARNAWKKQRDINELLYGDKARRMGQPVFTSPRGCLIVASSVDADIAKICKKAGIEKFTAHGFRDTFATRCVESGMEIKALQEIMGHTDIAMTLGLYAHSMEDRKQEQLKAVNFM